MIPPLTAHGDTLQVHHFGALSPDMDGKTRVDPSRFGHRKWTQAEKKALPNPPRAFFYLDPKQREWMFEHSRHYTGHVPAAHVYDAYHDPKGLMRDGGLPRIVSEGYRGVYYPVGDSPVVAMFQPVEVNEVEEPVRLARKAPKGGMVVNNLFSRGGRFVARPLARVGSVMQRLRGGQVQLSRAPGSGSPELQEIAAKYRQRHGVQSPGLSHLTAWSRPHAQHMASVYEGLKSDPNHPDVKAAYQALNDEVKKQYDILREHGYDAEYTVEDPYHNSAEMMHDLATRKKIRVFKTPAGHHPLMSEEESDRFRFVHDVFGHAMHGHQFGPRGEDNAYRDHMSMFSPLARRAMATETRGQNSWVNAGPHSHLPVTERPFAEQKVALWPEHLMGEYHDMPQPQPAKLSRNDPVGARRPLYEFETHDLGKLQPASRREHDRILERAVENRPHRLPTVDEVKALATFGQPVHGGYADAHRMMHTLMQTPGEAERWAAVNAALSANTPWLQHTEGATAAMALWHLAGHPTDEPTLRDLFGHTGRVGAGGTKKGKLVYESDKPNVFGLGSAHPRIPATPFTAQAHAPQNYYADKAQKLVRLFSMPHGQFVFHPKLVSDGSYKTPNFAYAHFDPDGVPIDTHMAKAIHLLYGTEQKTKKDRHGVKYRETIMDAKKRIAGSRPVQLAYKSLIGEAARQLGWEPRAVQEAVWVGVLSIMVAKRYGATDYAGVISRLNQRAMRAGWDMHSVMRSPTMIQALTHLGAADRLQAAIDASRKEHPLPPRIAPTTSDPKALASVAERLPDYIPDAAKPIVDALREGPVQLSRRPRPGGAFDALLHLAILATVS